MDIDKLYSILESGTKSELIDFCDDNDLVIQDGKIFHRDRSKISKELEYWDKRQLVKKINLNS